MPYYNTRNNASTQRLLIEATAQEYSRKLFSSALERDIFMRGVKYAGKKYQPLIDKQHEKMDN